MTAYPVMLLEIAVKCKHLPHQNFVRNDVDSIVHMSEVVNGKLELIDRTDAVR